MPSSLPSGTGSTSGGKLPGAVYDALKGGDYDAGALRLEVWLREVGGLTALELTGDLLQELGETELNLFGGHPDPEALDKELEDVVFPITVSNVDRTLTPGDPGGYWPTGDYTGWAVDVSVREYVTDPAGGALIFDQRLVLAEVTVGHAGEVPVATLLATHPLVGSLGYRWVDEDETALDWNGKVHSV